jgi:ABC-2 type transport system ATP-binding protein
VPGNAVELDAVTKRFDEHDALRGVAFTTIDILSTLVRPSTGRATVAGFDVVEHAKQVRAAVGLTGVYAATDELLTGRENLVLFVRLRGLPRRDARNRADEMLETFGLADVGDERVATYSGGMRRRDVWDLVGSLGAHRITALLTTQYLEEADALSDGIVVIDRGEVIADGTAEELKRTVGGSYRQVTPISLADVPRHPTQRHLAAAAISRRGVLRSRLLGCSGLLAVFGPIAVRGHRIPAESSA